MIYKQHKNGSYNIHTIKTDRFKNIQIEVIFRNNIDRKSVAKRTALFDLLLESNEFYKTKRDIILKQEELYNSLVFSSTCRIGNMVLTSVAMDMLNPKFAEYNYLSDALEFYFSLLFNPNIKDNEFDESNLNTIKNRLISDIKSLKENTNRYSVFRALNIMDKDSISSISVNGTIEEVESITPSNLYAEYLDIFKHDYVDIYVIGDFDENEMVDLITKYVKFNTIKNHEIGIYVDNKIKRKILRATEESDNAQSTIVSILNTVNLTEEEKKYAFQIYNMILGGGSLETKLYHNLRNDHSLCYNVYSSYQKYDNLLFITTAVDKTNTKMAIKLIEKTIKEMENNVTDEEVNNAISSKIASLNMIHDMPGRIVDEYLFRNITNLDPLEDRIEKYKNITKEDIMRVAKKVMMNTIYVLEGGGNNEEN